MRRLLLRDRAPLGEYGGSGMDMFLHWKAKWSLQLALGAAALLLFGGGYMTGNWLRASHCCGLPWDGGRAAGVAQLERASAIREQELGAKITQLEVYNRALAAAEKESRTTIFRQQERIHDLLRDTSLYQQVMADAQQLPHGIRVHGVTLRPISKQHYRYLITVQQFTPNSLPQQVRGHALVKLVGTNAKGDSEAWPLHRLANVAKKELSLDFRYFQHLEGYLRLPPGFQPEYVAVDLQQLRTGKGQKTSSVSGKFVWAPGETLNGFDRKS